MRPCIWLCAVLALALATCSDDSTKPPSDGPVVVGDKGKLPDGVKPQDAYTGWLDANPNKDSKTWGCTAGQTNMCDGYFTQHCVSGVCTPCPANTMDCDRTGDCECKGACIEKTPGGPGTCKAP